MPLFYIFMPSQTDALRFQIFTAKGRPRAFEMLKGLRQSVPGTFAIRREQLEHFLYGNAVLIQEEIESKSDTENQTN